MGLRPRAHEIGTGAWFLTWLGRWQGLGWKGRLWSRGSKWSMEDGQHTGGWWMKRKCMVATIMLCTSFTLGWKSNGFWVRQHHGAGSCVSHPNPSSLGHVRVSSARSGSFKRCQVPRGSTRFREDRRLFLRKRWECWESCSPWRGPLGFLCVLLGPTNRISLSKGTLHSGYHLEILLNSIPEFVFSKWNLIWWDDGECIGGLEPQLTCYLASLGKTSATCSPGSHPIAQWCCHLQGT